MSAFSLVLLVVGVFLLASALMSLLRSGHGRKQESMGCGFTLLAGLVWGIALGRYLDDGSAGLRLGFAFAFVLPALATLRHPGRGRMVGAIVMLTFAVIIGASALPKLWSRMAPSKSSATAADVAEAVEELGVRIDETEDYLADLNDGRRDVRALIASLGHSDFESIAGDPKGYALLQELADVDRLAGGSEQWLVEARADLDRMEVAARRLARIARGEEVTGVEVDEAEIARVLQEARAGPRLTPTITVEEHIEREALRDLFDEEFGGG